jgi:CYTH domain-containing protein
MTNDNIEIERKFLTKNKDWVDLVESVNVIKQAYMFSDEKKVVRVRSSYNGCDSYMGGEYTLTIKEAKSDITRTEVELNISHDQFWELYRMCDKGRIEKRRFIVHHGREKWEIDVFKDGLTVAEIELRSEDQQITLPDWIGEEVTGDPKYYNSEIAKSSL